MFKEFKEFAVKGNVVELGIAVVFGAAFEKIISFIAYSSDVWKLFPSVIRCVATNTLVTFLLLNIPIYPPNKKARQLPSLK